jgi:hypothetical protein
MRPGTCEGPLALDRVIVGVPLHLPSRGPHGSHGWLASCRDCGLSSAGELLGVCGDVWVEFIRLGAQPSGKWPGASVCTAVFALLVSGGPGQLHDSRLAKHRAAACRNMLLLYGRQ